MNEDKQGSSLAKLKNMLTSECALENAAIVYLDVWNMNCPECARFLHEGLSQVHGVLLVDVFYSQGVAVVTYDRALTTTRDLLDAVAAIGRDVCHYYGAEIIGQSSAQEVLERSGSR